MELEFPSHLAHLVADSNVLPCLPHQKLIAYFGDGDDPDLKIIDKEADEVTKEERKKHWKEIEAAMTTEIHSWASLGTFRPQLRKEISNVIDARWVIRWKVSPGGKRAIKARLTVRGFKDLQANDVTTFAGTTSRWGQRLICSIAAQHHWQLFSADVGAAFLKGLTFNGWPS